MDLQEPSASTILARRGLNRPSLRRNDSSFSAVVERADQNDDINISRALEIVSIDPGQKATVKEDLKLASQVRSEQIPDTPSAEKIVVLSTPNRYESWECGFGTPVGAQTPSLVPSRAIDFLESIQGELSTISSVKAGPLQYIEILKSGEHQVFSDDFVNKQEKSTTITIAQLGQIEEHLNEISEQVDAKIRMMGRHGEGGHLVSIDLQEAFGYAKPWVARTRTILINSHVFYKINYALASNNKAPVK